MANQTVTVLESDGVTETDIEVLGFGRQAAAASKSTAASTEDKAVLDAIAASLSVMDDWDDTNRVSVSVTSGAVASGAIASGAVASGAFASGAIGSGAVASGAVASGAVASGAFASGSIASGAIVSGAIAAGTASFVKLDDAAFLTTHALAGVGGVRDDALSTLTPVEGDWSPFRQTSTGALWVQDASLNANGQTDMAASSPVVIASDQSRIPVAGISNVYEVTPSTDTVAYASGDLIADTQQMDGFFRSANGTGVINNITITDEEAQNVKFYIYFMKTTTSFGTENSAPNISDANLSAGLIGFVTVETTDWVTLSGCSVACLKNIGLVVEAVSGTDDLYFAIVNATGTPDWDADSLKLKIGTILD
jgi:uncharacterized protein YjbI with pentapeptide repeats